MALADNEIWANGNPPPVAIEDASPAANTDVGQGLQCGTPINIDGLNWALHKYSSCLFGELNDAVNAAGVPYDPDNPVNITNAIAGGATNIATTIATDIATDIATTIGTQLAIQYATQIACETIRDRVFVGDSFNISSPSVTLPSGGSWAAQIVVLGYRPNPKGHFVNNVSLGNSDDDLRIATGAGTYAGGTILQANAGNPSEEMAMSVFAIRIDCPPPVAVGTAPSTIIVNDCYADLPLTITGWPSGALLDANGTDTALGLSFTPSGTGGILSTTGGVVSNGIVTLTDSVSGDTQDVVINCATGSAIISGPTNLNVPGCTAGQAFPAQVIGTWTASNGAPVTLTPLGFPAGFNVFPVGGSLYVSGVFPMSGTFTAAVNASAPGALLYSATVTVTC